MTTVFCKQAIKNKPHTHAFIVGVGDYPYLLHGGKEERRFNRPLKLEQLSSPPRSARALADWLIQNLNNPDAPLGSVEMLLSSSNNQYHRPNGLNIDDCNTLNPIEVDEATLSKIKTAFDIWYDRCNLHKDNVAIFYFCGHGIAKGDLALLARDFGENENRQFENSFNWNLTYQGMARCKAKTQCYFIDACRVVPLQVLEKLKLNNIALRDPEVEKLAHGTAPIIYATAYNSEAWGETEGISRLMDVLLRGLNGLGSKKINSRWRIDTRWLGSFIDELFELANSRPGVKRQECKLDGEQSGNSIIHVLPSGFCPHVPTIIDLKSNGSLKLPQAWALERERKALSCVSFNLLSSSCSYTWPPPHPPRWQPNEADAGIYKVEANFTDPLYNPCNKEEGIFPPFHVVTLEV